MFFTVLFLLSSISLSINPNDTLYLSLSEAIIMGQKYSPIQLEAKVDKSSSWLNLASSISRVLPTPSVSVTYTESQSNNFAPITTYKYKTYTGSVGLNQVLFDADVLAGVYKGKLYYDYYQLLAKDKIANLSYNIKVSYFTLGKAHNLYENAVIALKRAEDNYKLAQEKYRLGQLNEFELLRSEIYKTQAELDLLNAEKNLKVCMEDLRRQIGIKEGVTIKPTSTPSVPELKIDWETVFVNILKENILLKSSKKYKSINQMNFVQSIANLLPSIYLFGKSTYSDSLRPSTAADWKDKDVISYGIQLNFPFLEIKSYLLTIANAHNEMRRSRIQLKKSELLLCNNAIHAIFSYQEAKKRLEYAEKNLTLNQQLLQMAQKQYRLGGISQLDLFNAEINFNTAQSSYINALYDAYTSYAQIEYLLGISEPEIR
ncbi:MAG: TolC family protein [candidate division WOR-3 bacterium]|nr:TolC family protein [candidate division WOR-3 bacterium]